MYNKNIYGQRPMGNSNTQYHYVYRITNIVTGLHYYGVRSSKCIPQEDIGTRYFSSFCDKVYTQDQKMNPQNYKYKVVRIFETRKDAVYFEVVLHAKFNVKSHPKFVNLSNQTSSGFDSTGMCCAKCPITNVNLGSIPLVDPRWLTGEIVSILKGVNANKAQATCKATGIGLGLVSTDDPRWSTGEIVGCTSNMASAKCSTTNANLGLVSTDDPRWSTGEIVGCTSNMAIAICSTTNMSLGSISLTDPRWSTGEIVGRNKAKALATCVKSRMCLGYIPLDDPRWSTGEIVGYNTTFILITDGQISREYVADGTDSIPDGWYISILPKKAKLIDIFSRYTNELLYSCVVPTLFCKLNKYDPSKLGRISRSNFNEPNSPTNPHYHKDIYTRPAKALEQAVLLDSSPTN